MAIWVAVSEKSTTSSPALSYGWKPDGCRWKCPDHKWLAVNTSICILSLSRLGRQLDASAQRYCKNREVMLRVLKFLAKQHVFVLFEEIYFASKNMQCSVNSRTVIQVNWKEGSELWNVSINQDDVSPLCMKIFEKLSLWFVCYKNAMFCHWKRQPSRQFATCCTDSGCQVKDWAKLAEAKKNFCDVPDIMATCSLAVEYLRRDFHNETPGCLNVCTLTFNVFNTKKKQKVIPFLCIKISETSSFSPTRWNGKKQTRKKHISALEQGGNSFANLIPLGKGNFFPGQGGVKTSLFHPKESKWLLPLF